jgi:RNA polymerase sigma-70 factor (ECF subfamily)
MTESEYIVIFKKYNKPLIYFCGQILREKYLAEDVVADVMIKGFCRIDNFREELSIRSWLYLSCRNACVNTNKHTKVKNIISFAENSRWTPNIDKSDPDVIEGLIPVGYFLTSDIDIEDALMKADLMEIILREVESFPTARKKIAKLYLMGYSHNEIAEMLHLKLGGVCTQIKRFRDAMIERFKNFEASH